MTPHGTSRRLSQATLSRALVGGWIGNLCHYSYDA